jgi:hypothetical protein
VGINNQSEFEVVPLAFTATGEQALCEEKMFLKSLLGAKTMPVV